jgi:hypothetical protein
MSNSMIGKIVIYKKDATNAPFEEYIDEICLIIRKETFRRMQINELATDYYEGYFKFYYENNKIWSIAATEMKEIL